MESSQWLLRALVQPGEMFQGGEQAGSDGFDLQPAIKEFKGYKGVAPAGGGAGHG